jgi:hypothetical protein
MSIMSRIAAFARSPAGRRTAAAAMAYARSPKRQAQIARAREQIAARGAKRKGASRQAG